MLQSALARPLSDVFAVTLESPEPVTAPGPAAALDSLAATLRRMPAARGIVTPRAGSGPIRVPLVSRDGRSAALLVAFDPANTRLDTLVAPIRSALRATLARLPDGERYRVLVTGRAPLDRDERLLVASDTRRGELHVLPITFLILVLAFGALGAALLPVGIGALGVPVALVVLGLLTRVTPVSVVALTIVTMIGLGVGIDYSLLMVTRFREELARSGDAGTATERMLATAGRAVVTSGATVVIGFAALLLTPMVETRSVGLAGIVVVAVMVLLAVTLLPAVLMLLGRNVDWPRWLAARLAWYRQPTLWTRWASAIARRPLTALLAGALVLGAAIAPVFHMRVGLPANDWWPKATEGGQALSVLERIGVRGVVQPIRIVVQVPPGDHVTSALRLRGLKALSDSLRHDPRIGGVTSLVDLRPGTGILQYSVLYSDLPAARAEHREFLDAYLSPDARTTVVDAIVADTTSLTTTMELVGRIRALRDRIEVADGIRGLRGAQAAGRRVRGRERGLPARPAAAVSAADRSRAGHHGADAGGDLPVGADSAQGDPAQLGLGRGHVRDSGARVPGRLRRGAARPRRAGGCDLRGGADQRLRVGVRAEHGLRGVPAGADQGGVRQSGATTPRPPSTASPPSPRRSPRRR